MAISGSLRTMQFSELLQWLSTGLKTGTLIVRGAPGEKRVYFQQGKIISSSSTVEREFLGRFLVGFGFITEEELLRALQVQQESKVLLGKILVMIGAIREEELADLLRLKAAETIYDVFLWEDGSFAFLDGEIPALAMVTIASEVTGIVMEGLRRYDEWQRIRGRISSLRDVPAVLIPLEEGLNDREKMILSAIDGVRSIEQIASQTHNPDFHVAKFVYDLLESGHVQLVGETEMERTSPERLEAELQAEIASSARHPAIFGLLRSEAALLQPVRAEEPVPPAPPSLVEEAAASEATVLAQPRHPSSPSPTPAKDFRRFLRRDESDSRARRSPAPRPTPPTPSRTPEAETGLPEAVEAGDSPAPAPLHGEGPGPVPKVPLSSVPLLKKPMEELTSFSFTPNEAYIVSRINGLWDVRSIARISPFPEADVLRVLAKLEAGGVIAFK
ncbi:MAG: DUF4388 domain-containing protein [Acidithiobacillales bacterium]